VTPAALCIAIGLLWPDVPRDRACAAADAIVAEAGEHDPALLASLFYPESGFDNSKVNPRSGACGVGQTLYARDTATDPDRMAYQRRRCRSVHRSLRDGVRAAVVKLDGARETCAGYRWMYPWAYASIGEAREQLTRCAVAGYVGGPKAAEALRVRRPWIVAMVDARLSSRNLLRMIAGHAPGGAGGAS
jgi:hypothetical protein